MDRFDFFTKINEEDAYGLLATVDGDQPRVRPIAVKHTFERFYFSTFSNSDKMAQIKANPKVEVTWVFPDFSHARLEGRLQEHPDRDLKARYLEAHSNLQRFFKGADDPNYTLFEVIPSSIRFNAFADMGYEEIPLEG